MSSPPNMAALIAVLFGITPVMAQTTPMTFERHLNGLKWPGGQVLRFSELADCRELYGPAAVPNSPGRVQQLETELAAMQRQHREANHLLYAAGASRYGHLLESWQEVSRSSGEVAQELQQQLKWEREQNVSVEEIALTYACHRGEVTVFSAEGLQRCSVDKVGHHYRDGRHEAQWNHCLWLEQFAPAPEILDSTAGAIDHDQRIWVYAP